MYRPLAGCSLLLLESFFLCHSCIRESWDYGNRYSWPTGLIPCLFRSYFPPPSMLSSLDPMAMCLPAYLIAL
jgi:hypothetical protein